MKFLLRTLLAIVALFFSVVFATFTFSFIKHFWLQSAELRGPARIAVLDLTGEIWTAHTFLKDLDDLLDNKTIKAIVVRITSPGGLVAPSQEIYQGILKADKKTPVIISMGPLAASGGYYAALGGRKIFANPGTLTASIGVIVEFANTQKLYQWAKIERYSLKSGRFKDVGSPFREMLPPERDLLQKMIMDIYSQFRVTVRDRRKLTDAEVDAVADGRVMTGNQAKNAKLVDELGGLDDAIAAAKAIAKVPETSKVYRPEGRGGLLKRLLLGDDDGDTKDEISQALRLLGGWNQTLSQMSLLPATIPRTRVLLMAPLQ